MIDHPLQAVIDEMKAAVVSRKMSKSEQEKYAKLFPDHRFWMGSVVAVEVDTVMLTEWIRAIGAHTEGENE